MWNICAGSDEFHCISKDNPKAAETYDRMLLLDGVVEMYITLSLSKQQVNMEDIMNWH